MHYPNQEKRDEFQKIFEQKKVDKDCNFAGVWFPSEVDFNDYNFEVHAKFASAIFSERVYFRRASFLTADFSRAEFKKEVLFEKSNFYVSANFSFSVFHSTANFDRCDFISMKKGYVEAGFGGVDYALKIKFHDVQFKGNVTFDRAKFLENVDFRSAVFESPVRFYQTIFQDAEILFGFSSFKNQVRFAEIILLKNSSIRFFSSIFEKPEQVFFYKVDLEPHYFVNVDTRKFNFENVNFPVLANKDRVLIEINNLREKFSTESPYELLSTVCRRLATNSEENNRYEEASEFRQMAMESQRKKLHDGRAFWRLSWWYWLSSFYGESWVRALIVLLTILAVFSLIYINTVFYVCLPEKLISQINSQNYCEPRTLNFWEAVRHSLATASFQNVELRKPITGLGELTIILEKIFAPLQATLLALAIRRKFMR